MQIRRLVVLSAAALGPIAPMAAAQSVNDFRLPPGPDRPTPRVGPDADAPRAQTQSTATPGPTPAPTPAPTVVPRLAPTVTLPQPTATVPTPQPAPGGAAVRGRPEPTASASAQRTGPEPSRAGPAQASAFPPAATGAASVDPAAAPASSVPQSTAALPPPAAPVRSSGGLVLLAAAAVAIGLLVALFRRRSGRREIPLPPPALPQAEPLPRPARPDPLPPAGSDPAPRTDPDDEAALIFVPERLSLSLLNATLRYRLVVSNETTEPWHDVQATLDMIAAHASLTREEQLTMNPAPVPQHATLTLGPGESVEWVGDLRLPLAEVRPIHQGPAALLVPLVRLRLHAGTGQSRRTLVIGESADAGTTRLAPFRLDQGPRVFAAIAAQRIEIT